MKSLPVRPSFLTASPVKNVFFAVMVAALALSSLGCTTRKQYAINEAILISERRQLEDEIYRTKFELRDALRENEILHEALEKENPEAAKDAIKRSAKRPAASQNNAANNDEMFPGGDALRVDPSKTAPAYQRQADPDAYDASPSRGSASLPDFAPIRAFDNRVSQADRAAMDRRALNARQAQTMRQSSAVQQQRIPTAQNLAEADRELRQNAPQAAQNNNKLASQPEPTQKRAFGRTVPIAQKQQAGMSDEQGVVGQVSYEEKAETQNVEQENVEAPEAEPSKEPQSADAWVPLDEVDAPYDWSPVGL